MSTNLHFGEEASRRLEAVYMTPDVVAQRRETLRVLQLSPGERVLDIGSGPGFLASEMAEAVGPSGKVSGIDMSESMLAISRARCLSQSWVDFQMGDATRLPFPDGGFDVAVSTQVYEYVSDMKSALAELSRILRPGGRALILDTDWDSLVWNTTNRIRMNRILTAWEEHLVDPHLPRALSPKLKQAGFLLRHRAIIPILNPEYDPNTFSHGMIQLIAAFVAGRRGVSLEEANAWADEFKRLGETGSYFFSYLFLAVKPAG